MACDLILVLDAQSPRDVAPTLRQLQGTVRWVKVGSFGVEFIRMTPGAQARLKDYLAVLEDAA